MSAFAGYAHIYDHGGGIPGYVPVVQFGIKKHKCAMPGCREAVWSHYPTDRTTRQTWVFCNECLSRMPEDFIVEPTRVS